MYPFDLDGDGKLDPIELAAASTYYNELLHSDYNDAILVNDEDDLDFEDSDVFDLDAD